MDRMASSEFRKVYASLEALTEVTVNGHLIGTWVPVGLGRHAVQSAGEVRSVEPEPILHRFNSRPFTPVPRRGVPKGE